MLVEKVTLHQTGRQHTAVLLRQQVWCRSYQPPRSSVLTLKPNNGLPVLAPMAAVFQRKRKVVTQHWDGREGLQEPGDAAAATNAVAGAGAG